VNSINDDLSPDDFWAADIEGENPAEQSFADEESHEQELINLGDEEDEDFSIDEHPSIEDTPKTNEFSDTSKATINALSGINNIGPKLERVDHESLSQQIKMEILSDLKPLIKEMIREVLEDSNSETVEKVAWEVIPDLAENLIRKEVKELSQRVMDKHSLS